MELKITNTDSVKEKEGIWVKYYDVELRIARYPVEEAMAIASRFQRMQRNKRFNAQDPELRAKIIELMAEKVLVDWKRFYIGDNTIPYSLDNALNLLINDRDCLDFVTDVSRDIDNYMKEEQAETVGK